MLIYAIIAINLALVFYTIGVWFEKVQGEIKKLHVFLFWLGLFFDTTGTFLMEKMSSSGLEFSFHGITGLLAIGLMLFHALWATIVLVRNNNEVKIKFHKFSIFVWCIWLIPYISGVIFGISK